jgi:rRNA maturation endonuclease Nob1
VTGEKRKIKPQPCQCPYCNGAAEERLPFCQLCGAGIVRCPSCGKVLDRNAGQCPNCGSEIKKEAKVR